MTSALMVASPVSFPDRLGAGPAQLDAVVGSGVVTGGEHGARAVQQPGREVQLIGRGQPDPDHVQTLRRDTFGERIGQRR